MIRTLTFDSNLVPVSIDESIPMDINETYDKVQRWISMRMHDDIRNILPSIVLRTQSFVDDLLEDQRPRLQEYLTLEENEETYRVIVLKYPTNLIFSEDEYQLQITLLKVGSTLFSIINRDHFIISQIMSKMLLRKQNMDLPALIGFILEELTDNSIRVVDELEDEIERMEKDQFRGNVQVKGFLTHITDLKGRLYEGLKDARANLEVVRELMTEEPYSNPQFEHIEDRTLYMLDQLDNQRSSLNDVVNIHISMASHVMNQRLYWLTIIGSLLIIPTIISGLFGMNVPLPELTFYDILMLTGFLMGVSWILIKLIFMRNTLDL